jgi:UDP-N-acetylglucosamine--N-acetylmuramyl-(pentapeptide) pyrophosphoryl-undecaprenol N-acetylglucosamine transferase
MRILLAGGGSGGSATPILAVASELRARRPDVELLYVGTHGGPEAALTASEGIPYVGVATGKLRRYWDAQNLTDVGRVIQGVGQSLRLVRRFKPDVACGAGGFASVPPLLAAGVCRVPVHIHQQDAVPGLANKLLVPVARQITVALPQIPSRPNGAAGKSGTPSSARREPGRGVPLLRI